MAVLPGSARAPKLAEITHEDQALNWFAETIQQKVTKENAGFVQVEAVKRTSQNPPHLLITTPAQRRITLTLDVKDARRGN